MNWQRREKGSGDQPAGAPMKKAAIVARGRAPNGRDLVRAERDARTKVPSAGISFGAAPPIRYSWPGLQSGGRLMGDLPTGRPSRLRRGSFYVFKSSNIAMRRTTHPVARSGH
jgi:hypothetical protein